MLKISLLIALCLSNILQIFAQQNYYDPNNPNSPNYNPYNNTQFNNSQIKSDSLANQDDTTTYKVKKKWSWKKNPTVATLASTLVPGLGQIYNKKYWKAPIIWALLGVSSYFVWVSHNRYNDYRKGFFIVSGYDQIDGKITPFLDFEERKRQYEGLVNDEYGFAGIMMKNQMPDFFDKGSSLDSIRTSNNLAFIRDQSRQTRDYLGLGFLFVYVLNIVDAAVDAHFTDYDVSDKLSLKIEPKLISPFGTPQYGLSMTFSFKENNNLRKLRNKNNF